MKELLKNKTKLLHISIIVLGSIFTLLASFHISMWFDETYSVAMASHNFKEIWLIGSYDVHPVLYYWMLRIINIIFGSTNNILIYRLFSNIAVILLGILGITHIKKDFGEKTGLIFSFFTFFLPVIAVYANEIRMYTWAMLFVTLMAIYAYRIINNRNMKNWIIFAIFSLSSAYIHYYGLMTAGIINLILCIYLIKQAISKKMFTKDLKCFIVSSIIQIALYVPWLIYLMLQMKQVSENFWIAFKFPDTLIQMFNFQFTGNLQDNIYINNIFASIFGIIILMYVIYLICKVISNKENKKDLKLAIFSIGIYIAVIVASIIVSIFLKKSITYARYLLVITGLFILFISIIIGKFGNKYFNYCIYIFTIIIALYVDINVINVNYDKSNSQPFRHLEENINENDLIVYRNEGSGFVVSTRFLKNKKYFYNKLHWSNVDEAYKAYGPNMEIVYNLDNLQDYTGRIWFVGGSDYALYEEADEKYNLKLIDKKSYSTRYQKYQYTIVLVEK